MKKIAVTGGPSSGKTTVCRFLSELGAYVSSADEIVHHLLSSNPDVREKVLRLLGPDVFVDNRLSREATAKKVFTNPALLDSLENILHPLVFEKIRSDYEAVQHDPKVRFFVAEVPLLYETGAGSLFDFVVSVFADEELCKRRSAAQGGKGDDLFSERLRRQISPLTKALKADFVVPNNEDPTRLKEEVTKLAHRLQAT